MIASSLSYWEETFAEEIVIERPSKLPKEAAISKAAMPQHLACPPHMLRYVCLSYAQKFERCVTSRNQMRRRTGERT